MLGPKGCFASAIGDMTNIPGDFGLFTRTIMTILNSINQQGSKNLQLTLNAGQCSYQLPIDLISKKPI